MSNLDSVNTENNDNQTPQWTESTQQVMKVYLDRWVLAVKANDAQAMGTLTGELWDRIVINPDEPETFAAARLAEGHRAFKLKTGFGQERDLRNLRAMRDNVRQSALETVLLEAQAWEPLVADAITRALEEKPVDLKLEPLGVFALSQVAPPEAPAENPGAPPQLPQGR